MTLSWEAVLVVAFVVLPGLAYNATSAAFTAPERYRPSDVQITLRNLAVSAVLLSLEVLLATTLGELAHQLDLQLPEIVKSGLADYASAHPNRVLIESTSVVLINTALLGIAGWLDVPRKILQRSQVARGISPYRVWVDTIDKLSSGAGATIGARVYLQEGGVYAGALIGWSLCGEDQGGPDISLAHPVFVESPGGEWEGRGSAVVIPAKSVGWFEFYTEQ